eukprot:TRINITY_DN5186_c1_g1_i1.p1 TRINITY_DN5186_c1_g1~~TRINITY_DN5186_c1_g1_i1.p1  ORF type:complete len:412 (-),score=58.94 TRINITY_DN5186_c1_g1_i1:276-1511(-)
MPAVKRVSANPDVRFIDTERALHVKRAISRRLEEERRDKAALERQLAEAREQEEKAKQEEEDSDEVSPEEKVVRLKTTLKQLRKRKQDAFLTLKKVLDRDTKKRHEEDEASQRGPRFDEYGRYPSFSHGPGMGASSFSAQPGSSRVNRSYDGRPMYSSPDPSYRSAPGPADVVRSAGGAYSIGGGGGGGSSGVGAYSHSSGGRTDGLTPSLSRSAETQSLSQARPGRDSPYLYNSRSLHSSSPGGSGPFGVIPPRSYSPGSTPPPSIPRGPSLSSSSSSPYQGGMSSSREHLQPSLRDSTGGRVYHRSGSQDICPAPPSSTHYSGQDHRGPRPSMMRGSGRGGFGPRPGYRPAAMRGRPPPHMMNMRPAAYAIRGRGRPMMNLPPRQGPGGMVDPSRMRNGHMMPQRGWQR